jgi:flagellar brake protein
MHADFQPTQPAPAAALSGRAIDEFRVDAATEVLSLLRRLAEGNVLVQLSAPGGAGYTSVLWTVDAHQRRIGFDADPAHPQIRALVDAGEATAVAYLDTVKLQFELHGLLLVHGARASTLQAALPAVLYRFQRRQSFRVRTHEGAVAHLLHPEPPHTPLALRVIDVSAGGCALALPDGAPAVHAGADLRDARIELDAQTRLETVLHVEHVSGGFSPGARGVRLGCSFGRLDGPSQRALQRYIDLTQRKARMLSLG